MNSVAYNSSENYRFLKHLLQDEFGVILGEEQVQQVTDRLDSVMDENEIDSLQELTEKLHDPGAAELRSSVLHAITEQDIDWFGYPEIMSVFEGYVLPNIDKTKKVPYRVWVVGCGDGQTAFSLAIAADKYMKNEGCEIDLEIIATDSSEATVSEGARASFKPSFLNGLSNADRSQYMTLTDEMWVVNDEIKSMVSFSVANPLYLESSEMDSVDLIICPDILAYYTVSSKVKVLESFSEILIGAGILMAGANEPIIPFCSRFVMVEHGLGTFYRKQN